jgi:hypothetical protein
VASQSNTVTAEAQPSGLIAGSNRDALVKASSAAPLLGDDPNGGKYIGRIVIEVWEPNDSTVSDGLRYLVAPMPPITADDLLGLAKGKLAKRT